MKLKLITVNLTSKLKISNFPIKYSFDVCESLQGLSKCLSTLSWRIFIWCKNYNDFQMKEIILVA